MNGQQRDALHRAYESQDASWHYVAHTICQRLHIQILVRQ